MWCARRIGRESSAAEACMLMTRPHTQAISPFFIVSNVDPDALAAEFAALGAAFSAPLKDTHDGLRGFEICDPDGYVLFFGRPA